MKEDLILVIGATGTIGSEVVRILKNDGYRIRSTTSRKNQLEKNQVHLNLLTGEGILAAMDGVDRAFFLSPPGYADQHGILSPLIQEAKRRGLKKVVMMTTYGINAIDSFPFRRAEFELEKSGLMYNIVRPNWFFQNFNNFFLNSIRNQRKIKMPAGNSTVSFIDIRDTAAVIARLLVTDELYNQTFDLTGPQSVNYNEVAKVMTQITRHQICYEEINSKEYFETLLSEGVPRQYAEFLDLRVEFMRDGFNSQVNSNVELILGRKPYSLEKYVNDYQKSWM